MHTTTHKLTILCAIGLGVGVLTTSAQDATACSLPYPEGIGAVPMSNHAPLDSPILVKTIEYPYPGEPNYFGSHQSLGMSPYTVIEVRAKQDGTSISGSTAVYIGQSTFTPATPLAANTAYIVVAKASELEFAQDYTWEFTTSDVLASKPSSFEGIGIERIQYVQRPVSERCDGDDGVNCGFDDVEKGWEWAQQVRLTFSPIKDTEHGSSFYNYVLSEHTNAQDIVGDSPRHLNHLGNTPSEQWMFPLRGGHSTTRCFSLKAYRIDTPDKLIDSTAGIICKDGPPKPTEVPPPFLMNVCDSSDASPDMDMGGDATHDMDDWLCDIPPDLEPHREPTHDMGQDPLPDSTSSNDQPSGCSSAPGQDAPSGLMWLLAVMGLMWRTRRQP